jgi:hypothetical protein
MQAFKRRVNRAELSSQTLFVERSQVLAFFYFLTDPVQFAAVSQPLPLNFYLLGDQQVVTWSPDERAYKKALPTSIHFRRETIKGGETSGFWAISPAKQQVPFYQAKGE